MIKTKSEDEQKEMIHFNIYRFVGVCRLFQQQLFWLVEREKTKDRLKEHQRGIFSTINYPKFCSIEIQNSDILAVNQVMRILRQAEK